MLQRSTADLSTSEMAAAIIGQYLPGRSQPTLANAISNSEQAYDLAELLCEDYEANPNDPDTPQKVLWVIAALEKPSA